ncbi:allophanate hydrolase [Streptomyces sp. MP131-18]|uniref:allophanate hydrolase n=1 Tax=Streptomyces sp. MP131-18 TaxID=1857892 RepID=UPI00097CBDA8|nr:allophanate hydrolase [Streptomyces sp. MP131-18]ONK10251.1 Allophanate hydrolase [Streptomyces sp. MP131-18]
MTAAGTATARVRRALALLDRGERPEAWIAVRPADDLLAEAAAVDAAVAAGTELPLAGQVFAVKDNIDTAGLPTTAGCPGFAYRPEAPAPAVARLTAAGAIVAGKTNLDQFATGLVGTRSPYGAVRAVHDPARVSGGSSSGSAVAVALGIVDFALGTDTAGSGRVPAAFQGIVGLKPTLGLVSTHGVVPAARPFDCVSVLAPTLAAAETVAAVLAGGGARDWPADAPLAAPPAPRVAVPAEAQLDALGPDWRKAFADAVERLRAAGARVETVDVQPFLDAARLLYEGGFAAERYAAFGAFVAAGGPGLDGSVRAVVEAAGRLPAHAYAADLARLAALRAQAMERIAGCAALLLPTAPEHPTLAEVAADPHGVNRRLGTYTNFVNLLDLSAVAVPAGTVNGGPFGVTVIARAFADRVAADIAALLVPAEDRETTGWGPPGLPLAVFGAHLRGLPLNHQLTDAGARLLGEVRTAPRYRMAALPGSPPRPGLLRVADGEPGHGIEGELWALPPAALGRLLAALPAPMALGRVLLADGREVTGFLCEAHAVHGAPDISGHGSWRSCPEQTRKAGGGA